MREKTHNYSMYRGVLDDIDDETQLYKKPFRDLDELHDAQMHIQHRNSVRDGWKRLIIDSGPYSAFWTLSFCRPYNDAIALAALDAVAKFVSREIAGPRWHKHSRGIDALVVAEQHVVSQELRGRLHFHVLVRQQANFPETLEPADLADLLEQCSLRLTDTAGRKMTTKERVVATEVWDLPGMADYLSKAMTSSRWGGIGGNLFFIRNASVDGVVVPLQSERELLQLH